MNNLIQSIWKGHKNDVVADIEVGSGRGGGGWKNRKTKGGAQTEEGDRPPTFALAIRCFFFVFLFCFVKDIIL